MQALVPRSRRPKFDLILRIIDLHNVPLVSGTSFIKWHLPHSTAAEHRGRTSKCYIREHKVSYDYEKNVPIRLTVDKHGILQENVIEFEVIQEYSSGSKGERITLGNVKLNLAEYVDTYDEDGEEGICRRYLMQDSKINSTLKVGIRMVLMEGERNFEAPPLKTAPVFVGIAGIMASEQGDGEDVGHMPTLSSKSRENGEIQDMYRRNLAASWTAQPGELRADECIEDIFAGGDGWAKKGVEHHGKSRHRIFFAPDDERDGSASDSRPNSSSRKHEAKDSRSSHHEKLRPDSHHAETPHDTNGPSSLEQHTNSMKAEGASQTETSREVDEFTLREDLRSWKLPQAEVA